MHGTSVKKPVPKGGAGGDAPQNVSLENKITITLVPFIISRPLKCPLEAISGSDFFSFVSEKKVLNYSY